MAFKAPLLRLDGALLTAKVQQFNGITAIDVALPLDASEALQEGLSSEAMDDALAVFPEIKGQKCFAEREYERGTRKVRRMYFSPNPDAQVPDDDLD